MKESRPLAEESHTAQPEAESPAWHARSAAETMSVLGTDPEHGLSPAEAAERLAHVGPNTLARARREPWWEEMGEVLAEPLVLLLIAVAVVYAFLGEIEDAATIGVVILAVAGVEVVNEARAKRAIAALRSLSAPRATVVHAGQPADVPAAEVVPGDVVLLQPGQRVPADLRLVETAALRIDESSLTGESAPVAKRADIVLAPETELADRVNLAFAGTLVTAGKGRGLVVATGRATELGRVAELAAGVKEPPTPLQQQLRQLAGWLLWVALGFSVLVPVLGVLVAGRPWREMLLTGLTLAFATIPEELPILITTVLAIGAYRLARRQAIVKRLQAAETLGSVSAIGTDKTGTLTENRMRVVELWAGGALRPLEIGAAREAARLLEIGVLANDAQLIVTDGRDSFVGDPTETALLAAAETAGLRVGDLRAATRVLEEFPFDDRRNRMSVVCERDGARWIAAKGAPEAILDVCRAVRLDGRVEPLDARWLDELRARVDGLAARGFRLLAFAERRLGPDERPDGDVDSVEAGLTLVGLAGLEDPPRPEVPEAIATLRSAGVRVLMLTGDHPATARAIAERVGIEARRIVLGRELERVTDEGLRTLVRDAAVFARITPEHKLRIVRSLQEQGAVVAVTGDGVNDAPALRAAAIGIAMGRTGTDVAREAAGLVLADDNFATVAAAVHAGRTLYENLRKAVRYYLAAKLALVTASVVAVLAQLPVPFAPVQIIVLELFMDLGAATTFVAEPPEGDVMARPPRDPRHPFVDRPMRLGILAGGLSLAAAVVVAYLWAWGQGPGLAVAQSAAFVAWMVGHVVLAAHMRSERQPLLRMGLLTNRVFLLWAAAALVGLVLSTAVPTLRARLHLAELDPTAWTVALAAGLLFPSWWEVAKWVRRRRTASGP